MNKGKLSTVDYNLRCPRSRAPWSDSHFSVIQVSRFSLRGRPQLRGAKGQSPSEQKFCPALPSKNFAHLKQFP